MNSSVAAVLGSIVGGVAVAVAHAWLFPPTQGTGDSTVSPRLARDAELVNERLDQLQLNVQALQSIPEPVRVEAVPTSLPEVVAAQDRISRIEDELQGIRAQLEALQQARSVEAARSDYLKAGVELEALNAGTKVDATVVDEFKAKFDSTDATNAAALVNLAEWAGLQGLKTDEKRLLRMAVKVDPDNPVARERLGYQKYDGKWMTAREVERVKSGN